MNTISEQKTYAIFANPAQRKLIEKLETNGSKVFQFTPPEPVKIESEGIVESVINAIAQSDWIVFTDVFAVEYFLEILETKAIDLFELDEIRVVACGEAVADRLRFVQLHADIITNSEDTNTVFSAILNYVGESEIGDTSFFILKEIEYCSALKDKLSESKAKVTEMPIYQLQNYDKKEIAKLKTLLTGGAIDEFIFTSPEDVIYIKNYFYPKLLTETLFEAKILATSEIVVHSLKENGLQSERVTINAESRSK